MPRNPDQVDCIMIKRNAEKSIKVNGQVRLGQAVFAEAYRLYPDATNNLRNTKYDCYYDDSRIDLFLLELQTS
jgi:hypothetical protein